MAFAGKIEQCTYT